MTERTNEAAVETEVQFGVRYGGGEVEGDWDNAAEAEQFIESLRRNFHKGSGHDIDDYEPMTVVTRTVESFRRESPWTAHPNPEPPTGDGEREGVGSDG